VRNGACRLPLLSLSPLTLNDGDKRETFSFSLSSLPSPLSSSPLPLPWWQPASPAASRRRVVSSLHSSRGLLLPPPVLPRRWRRRRCSARRRRPPLRPPPARLRSSADCPLAAASRAGCGLVFSPYLCIFLSISLSSLPSLRKEGRRERQRRDSEIEKTPKSSQRGKKPLPLPLFSFDVAPCSRIASLQPPKHIPGCLPRRRCRAVVAAGGIRKVRGDKKKRK